MKKCDIKGNCYNKKIFLQENMGVVRWGLYKVFAFVCGECVYANNQISHDVQCEFLEGFDSTLFTSYNWKFKVENVDF